MAYARIGHAQFQYEYAGYKNIYTYDFDESQYAYCMLYEYKNIYICFENEDLGIYFMIF